MTLPESYDPLDLEQLDPRAEVSRRSRGVALVLGTAGFLGLHRFYVGKLKSGVLWLFTGGLFAIGWLYDLVLIVAGEFRDRDDLPLRHWQVEDPRRGLGGWRGERRLEDLEDRCDTLGRQVDDLAERLDFAERMLAQQRERPPTSLPRE